MRSDCPIASSLDLVGDRWSLVIIRDLMFSSKRRYGELLDGPERITTNILANRLDKLTAAGIVSKRAYQKRPPRYEYHLTAKGRDLFDVLRALIEWGGKHVPGAVRISNKRLDAMDPR